MGRMRAFSDFLGLTRLPSGTIRPWQSQRLIEWSREHPVLDGMFLGVPVLLLLSILTAAGLLDISALSVLTIVLLSTGLGALMGIRRGRRIQRGDA